MFKSYLLRTSALLSCIICLLLSSCARKEFSDTLNCSELSNAIQTEILTDGEYAQYSLQDIEFMFDESYLPESYSVIYSVSSDDIGEIGIFRADSLENSQELFDEVLDYISELKEEKSSFVKNYLPHEQSKLDNAQAKQFGKYVVFTVLDSSERDAVFKKIEQLLD